LILHPPISRSVLSFLIPPSSATPAKDEEPLRTTEVEALKSRLVKLSQFSNYDSSERRGHSQLHALTTSYPPLTESERKASLPLPDAIHLIELSERIKNDTKMKSLQRDQEKKTHALHSLGEKIGTVEAMETKSLARKNYQEYFQTRQHAAVMIDEYLTLQDTLREQQVLRPSVCLSV
jgi:hypothetical protein